jgi:mono/diheme cytochrome c family protein
VTGAARGLQRGAALAAVAVLVAAAGGNARAAEHAAIPAAVAEVLEASCVDCHSGDAAEAGVALDGPTIDWSDARDRDLWRRVAEVVENRRMPPADAPALEAADRAALLGFLEPALVAHTPFDATATLPDGTVVSGPVELKAWLVDNIDLFAACLAEKLATFATGRVPTYAERHELRALARAACEPGRGFQDLVLDLIDSRTFRTR